MDKCRFGEKQNWSEGNYAKESLIGRTQEKIFQIRMQEIIAKYSCAEKFPAKIILPDTKARPMGFAIKDLFYTIAEANGFPIPQVVFVATPKISKNNRPDTQSSYLDQFYIISMSQIAEFNKTTLLDPNLNMMDFYSNTLLKDKDRQNMQSDLVTMRSVLLERIKKINIENGSSILVIDDVVSKFTTLTEIGIAIKLLNNNARIYFEPIFCGTKFKENWEPIRICQENLGDNLKTDLHGSASNWYGHFKWYGGNFKRL
jgi:hypothetical protein